MSVVPEWQSDNDVTSCILCGNEFTFWYRKHHCRMCGRVVCGNCSPTYERYLPTSYVVTPANQQFLENPHNPHRTCTECADELRMIRRALISPPPDARRARLAASQQNGPNGTLPSIDANARAMLVQNVTPVTTNDHLGSCPVCNTPLYRLPQYKQEEHVDNCLKSYSESPQDHVKGPQRKRMLISKLHPKESAALGDCMICYEDFEPGQTIGRLECMCVFHEKCILEWFGRKGLGSCPLHNQGD